MPRRASLFDFQFENAVVYDDLVPFRLTFEDPERRKLYEAALQEAEQLIWKGTFDRLAQDVFFSREIQYFIETLQSEEFRR